MDTSRNSDDARLSSVTRSTVVHMDVRYDEPELSRYIRRHKRLSLAINFGVSSASSFDRNVSGIRSLLIIKIDSDLTES